MKSIKDLRTKLGISQKNMAVYLGVASKTLMKAEKGEKNLSQTALMKVADIEKTLSSETFQHLVKDSQILSADKMNMYKARCEAHLAVCMFNQTNYEIKLAVMK